MAGYKVPPRRIVRPKPKPKPKHRGRRTAAPGRRLR